MKVAVVGATGLVGNKMLKILEERNFPVRELIPVASKRSEGKTVLFRNEKIIVKSAEFAINENPDFALFSAGSELSLKLAERFAEKGTFVIDNSSAWRMNDDIPLVIPEINSKILTEKDKIVANPNCSTIQMLMVLAPLHEKFKLKRLVISTYQSVTGTGMKAVKQLENEMSGIENEKVYPYKIFKNCLPHCDSFTENGYTKEEIKLVNETRKILSDKNIGITATAVRVPVSGGHSESVNAEFYGNLSCDEIRNILSLTKGVKLLDNPAENIYPMPFFSEGKDEVFVGRIREDLSQKNTFNFWITADNLRKGAATNAVQIAEYILNNFKERL